MRTIALISLIFIATTCISQSKYDRYTKDDFNYLLWIRTKVPWYGHFIDVKLAIERGADIDFNKPYGSVKQTPFLNAAGAIECLDGMRHRRQGELDSMEIEAVKIVKYLAEKGANVHATTVYPNLNALHLAAKGGREKVIPILVDLGLDIDSRNADADYGSTVLWYAINAGDLATVKAVVEAGADIDLCLLDGNSPLDFAKAYANPKAKEHLSFVPYRDQVAIAEYLESKGAKHGKNNFKGMLYLDN